MATKARPSTKQAGNKRAAQRNEKTLKRVVKRAVAKKQPVKKVLKKAAPVVAAPVAKHQQLPVGELVLTHRENGRKLARSMLRRWQVIMPAEEIDSLVDLTLCEAARRYDCTKGASFITFFFYHLRGHLVRAVASAANDSNIFLALAQSAGIDTTDWSTLSEDNAVAVMPDLLLNAPTEAESPEALLIKKERVTLCRDACIKLDELEKEIIDRSYVQDEALVDIAKVLGYSRCHISRVKKRALDRLRGEISERTLEALPQGFDDSEELEGDRRPAARRNRRRRIALQQILKTAADKAVA